MDQQALASLVAKRRVVSPSSVSEPLGLAIELLRADSISRALQSLHRDSFQALLATSRGHDADPETLEELAGLGLIGLSTSVSNESCGNDYVALPEVSEALPPELPLINEAFGGTQAKPADLTGWFTAGLTSVRRVTKMLHTISRHPVRLGRKGQPAVVALRDLAENSHCTAEQSAHLVSVMRAAGLLGALVSGKGVAQLGITDAATQHWLMQLDYSERWIELARATASLFDARLLRGVRESGGNLRLCGERLPHDYPQLPATELSSIRGVIETAEELGLTVHGWLTEAADSLLLGDTSAALALAKRDMPAAAAGVYLQPDLSIIVPGPLHPHDEAILHAIAETEQLGPAASMRVSPERLSRAALQQESSTQHIRAALERLSFTGIPQPLDYLLRDLDRRSGAYSTHAPQVDGPPQSNYLLAQHAANAPDQLPAPTSQETELQLMIARVLSASLDAGNEGDLTRRLELAIRDRTTVRVTAVAGKDEREFTLLPVSLKSGRLRATDQVAGVERTLPVTAITEVTAVATLTVS